MPSDIEIAQKAKMRKIADVAKERLGIHEDDLENYGSKSFILLFK
jgi:formate--tetrahydrofolate ligase